MRKKPNLPKRLERCKGMILEEPTAYCGNWLQTFGGEELHLEIGAGKGKFLVEMAKENPHIFFVGIEREEGALVIAAEKAIAENLPNIRFLDVDAVELLSFFAPHEINRIYLNFSDPWPKKKQWKRRLTYRSFLDLYWETLCDNGAIYQKTDNMKLFEFSLNEFAAVGYLLKNITFDLHATDLPNVMTEYETRFVEQGLPIYRAEAHKQQNKLL